MPAAIVIPTCLEPLTHERRWLVWRREQARGGRITKVPYRADRPSSHASSNDPATWCSFDTAMRTYTEGGADGIAFALLDSSVTAFDLDHCRDAGSGTLHEWAQRLVERCGSYVEITPSHEGIRILGTGSGQKIHRKFSVADGASIEVYRNCERFITVTGDQISPTPDRLADIDAVADQIVAELEAAKQTKQQKPALRSLEPHGRHLADIIENGCGTGFGGDKSRAVWFVIHALLEQGRTTDEITSVLIDPNNEISTHLLSRSEDPTTYAHRQISKAMSERAKSAKPPIDGDPDSVGAEIVRLATLSPLHYEKVRSVAAGQLGVRSGVLDGLVKAERRKSAGDGSGLQGHAIELSEPEPWETPVDGAALLDEIVSAIQRYVVLPVHAARACACWVVHTFLVGHFLVSPRLSISSPTKGCGKTTLLDVLYRLVLRPLLASNVTPAAVFRVIEKYRPCLLIDEADTFLGVNDELRGILNSGHRKGGSVLRVTGDDLEPRQFATFAPCGIALIGTLPPTLADRSIPIELNRRRPNEPVESFRPDRTGHLDALARQAARWAQDNAVAVAAVDPEMPAEVTNRARDNWRVLKAISTVAGGKWPDHIDDAAKAAQTRVEDEASRLELLLADIRAVGFNSDDTEVGSADLAQRLIELEGRPWAEFDHGRPLTQNRLARLLKPLGIGPENVGPENSRVRGYKRHQFQDAFERYLAPAPTSELHRCTERDEIRTSRISEPHSPTDGCAVGKCEKFNNDGLLCGCAVARGGIPPNGGDEPGLSDYRIRQLAGWYLDRGDAERRETGTIRQTELDEALRMVLVEDGVFPEFIGVEIERVMRAVFEK
jgi:putative DNA primase/helicase